MDIITRAQWGSEATVYRAGTVIPQNRRGVVLHHSVTGQGGTRPAVEALLRGIERLDRDTNGWPGTYNFAIDYDGRIYEMSGLDGIGTHAAGHNTAYWGICYIGDGREEYPEAARDSTRELVAALTKSAGHPLDVVGHQDLNSTACPGPLIQSTVAYFGSRGSKIDEDGRLGRETITRLQERLRDASLYTGPVDGVISKPRSATVAAVQRYLNAHGAHLVVDGAGLWQTGEASHTIAALQRWLGTDDDGRLDVPVSVAVRALQQRLNAGAL